MLYYIIIDIIYITIHTVENVIMLKSLILVHDISKKSRLYEIQNIYNQE